MKVMDSLLNISEIKKKKTLLNEEAFENISMIFFNTGLDGSTSKSKKKKKNKFKNYFY
jgi:hypothetical protein